MIAEARVRTTNPNMGAGVQSELTATRMGALGVADVTGRFVEAVRRGDCYAVAQQSGVTSQAGLSATTPVLTLYNPLGSGINAAIWAAACTVPVAVAAGMVVWLGVNTNVAAAAVTGTLTTTHRNLLLGSANTPRCTPLLAATLPAAPVALLSIVNVPGTIALNSQQPLPTFVRQLDGCIVLAPGSAVSFQTSTASGTNGLAGEFIWEEFAA